VTLVHDEPGTLLVQLALVQVTVVLVAKELLYSKYVVLSNGKTCPKPNVPNDQQLIGMPVTLVLNPQNWLIVPSTSWRNGHDPPPQAALPVPVFVLSHELGLPARVVQPAPPVQAGEKSAQTS
jgi:hypothetical protein